MQLVFMRQEKMGRGGWVSRGDSERVRERTLQTHQEYACSKVSAKVL